MDLTGYGTIPVSQPFFLPIARNSFAIIYHMVYHVAKLGEKINRIEQNKLALNQSKIGKKRKE